MTTRSLAGTWGQEKRSEGGPAPDVHLRNTTVYREQFSVDNIAKYRDETANRFTRFKELQDKKVMIMKYSDNVENGGMRNDLRLPFHTPPNMNSSSGFVGGEHGNDYNNTSSLLMCTSNNPHPSTSRLKMTRTHSRIMSSADAPIAVGRSGHRVEKGVSTSGLLGEKLMLSDDPQRNSKVQRSWLYCDDPALGYKLNGVPVAYMPNDVSLPIGEGTKTKPEPPFGRKAPHEILSKTNRNKSNQVFAD